MNFVHLMKIKIIVMNKLYKLNKMNYFGVFTNPDLQTAMAHAVKGSYMPNKYPFINNLKQVNKK